MPIYQHKSSWLVSRAYDQISAHSNLGEASAGRVLCAPNELYQTPLPCMECVHRYLGGHLLEPTLHLFQLTYQAPLCPELLGHCFMSLLSLLYNKHQPLLTDQHSPSLKWPTELV